MPQLNEAVVDTIFGTLFCQFFIEDISGMLDQNDDSLLVYNNATQLS